MDLKFSRPFSQTERFTLMSNQNRVSSVGHLLPMRSPSAVARLIVSVIVNSVERVIRSRLLTHVFKECCEGILPAIAHGDAATSVMFVGLLRWVKASIFGTHPATELAAFPQSVLGVAFNDSIDIQASAAFSVAV